jgi:LysR family glycine cleavage system transcriptional activator
LGGQGIALVRDIFATEELASGRLVCVLDLAWPAEFAYYLVTRPEALRQRKVTLFRDWLLREAAMDHPGELADRLRLTIS